MDITSRVLVFTVGNLNLCLLSWGHHLWMCICCYYGVTMSKKTESDRDIRKTSNMFKNLKFCGKMKDCTDN